MTIHSIYVSTTAAGEWAAYRGAEFRIAPSREPFGLAGFALVVALAALMIAILNTRKG